MAIHVRCPNGHPLRVKDEYAGKSGYCPFCHARVHVPGPEALSDDDILAIVQHPSTFSAKQPEPVEQEVHQESQLASDNQGSGLHLHGSSIVRRQKVCPNCFQLTSPAFTHCPRCATPLTVPQPVSTEPQGE